MPHICCRDKNAIAIRSTILGASLNHITNFLLLTGDPVPVLFRQTTKSVFNFDSVGMMKIVQEMYARGFEFVPIDIYRAKAKMFQIVDGKLMPSLASIEGMGDKAAEAVEEAAKDGAYLSLDDFRQRTKVSKTVIDLMAELGLFGDLPQSNQLSLFDFT